MPDHLLHLTSLTAALDVLLVLVFVPWVLMTKKDSTSAVAWCLVIVFLPLLGALLFWVFGYVHIARPLRRVRKQRSSFREKHPPRTPHASRGDGDGESTWAGMDRLARQVDAFPVSEGNAVRLFHETTEAFPALLEELGRARQHIHLEFYILESDPTGEAFIDVLARRAREGVRVRLLLDAMGCVHLKRRTLKPLLAAGGKAFTFLPLNPLRSRIQVNLRNHRKIAVLDGRVAFTGGMNIGSEYLGLDPRFGYWRDAFVRLEGPAVAGLQRLFTEDWDLAAGEPLDGEEYFPDLSPLEGGAQVQVIGSGPDQEVNGTREIVFAALLAARQRLWIASPYFVPDAGILDALRLARYRGVDVRLLTLYRPDEWLTWLAGRYYWAEVLGMGVKVYLYRKGMMHAKFLTADGRWGLVGSANLDNRSLHLAFEAGVMLYTPALVAELDERYQRDLEGALLLDPDEFARRPLPWKLAENACRLLSPLL